MRLPILLTAASLFPTTLGMPKDNFYLLLEPDQFDTSACLRSCFREEPACPENMDAQRIHGTCWTCCLRMDKRHSQEVSLAGLDLDRDGYGDGDVDDQRKCHLRLNDYCCKAEGCAYCCKGVCASDTFASWEGHCLRGL
ncbi:uncharacterized protein BDV17DRAFT_259412 [Aspergillus undulatus]|uniref:uncharacterized protein n=1 Tax=Aspergillus undulatus TaxID=1810928 RepID=UPI003CCD2CC2